MCLQPSRRVEALHLVLQVGISISISSGKYKYKCLQPSRRVKALHLLDALVLPDKYKCKYKYKYKYRSKYLEALHIALVLPLELSRVCSCITCITCMLYHVLLSRVFSMLLSCRGGQCRRGHMASGAITCTVQAPRLFLHTRMLLLLLHLGEEIAVVSKAIPRISRSRQPRGCGPVSPCA